MPAVQPASEAEACGRRYPVIDPALVENVDAVLDAGVSQDYKEQLLAQDWARVAKLAEEAGEAVAELISWTGQNPRKPQDHAAYGRLLAELADAALTGVYAIQHFTKDIEETRRVMRAAQDKHLSRLLSARDQPVI